MRRIIAMFLALTMCIAFLPIPTVAAANVPAVTAGKDRLGSEPVTYYFDCYAFGEIDKTAVSSAHVIDSFTDAGYTGRKNDVKSAKWGLFGMSSTNNARWRTQSLEWNAAVPENGAVFTESDDVHYVIFELDVPKKGTYSPSFTYYGLPSSSEVDIFLIEKPEGKTAWTDDEEIVKALVNTAPLFHKDLYYPSTQSLPQELPEVSLSAGRNLFVMVLNGKNEASVLDNGGLSVIRPISLTLSPKLSSDTSSACTLDYNFTLGAFEYEKMPRNSANTASWIGVRASSTVLPENVVDTTKFQGIMNTAFFDWNVQLNAVAEEENGAVKVLNEKVAYKDGYHKIVEPYYAMKTQENDAYWAFECASSGSTNHRAWAEGFFSFFAAAKHSTAETVKTSNDRPLTAFRIYVANPGKYRAFTKGVPENHAYQATGITSDMYIMKAPAAKLEAENIDGLLADESFEYIGSHNSKNSELTSVGDKIIELSEAGEYILLFNTDADTLKESGLEGTTGSNHLVLSSLRLMPVLPIDEVKVTLEDEGLSADSYTKASVEAFDTNGEALDLAYAAIEYSSSDERIATVNKTTGEIYAKNGGEVTIFAKVTINGSGEKTGNTVLNVTSRGNASQLPETLYASFPEGHLSLGESTYLHITDEDGLYPKDGITYSYEITDDSIVSEKDGAFTALKLGKTDVTVTATLGEDSIKATFSAVVVGENLLTRNEVRHGEFENGIYLRDNSEGKITDSTMWNATRNTTRDMYDFTMLRGVASDITRRKTNVAKISVDGSPSSREDGWKVFRLEGNNKLYDGTTHQGNINLETGKIYEFTGFVKLENVKTMPEVFSNTAWYRRDGDTLTYLYGKHNYYLEDKNGDVPWTRFNSEPVYINWDNPATVNVMLAVYSYFTEGYNAFISHLSYHEVKFETVEFSLTEEMKDVKTFDTFKTSVRTLSSSGKEIIFGDTAKALEVKYSSTNPVVARVDENGVITAVSDGECEILAEITFGDVTQVGRIPIKLSGLEVKFESIRASAEADLSLGETSQISVEYLNTDATPFTGTDSITHYYESANPAVASVDQNGLITAAGAGSADITVFASSNGYTAKTVLTVNVSDSSPLLSAHISGTGTVEAGFETQLSASAVQTSGGSAQLDLYDVKFELCNGEDENVLDITENGVVKGLSEGTARVRVTVSKNADSVTSEPFEIEVISASPKNKRFDFRIHPNKTNALTPTIEKHGYAINRDETAAARVAASEIETISSMRFLTYGIQFSPVAVGHTRDADLAIDILVDYDGWYQPTLFVKRASAGGIAKIYMNGTYLGECDFSSGGNSVDLTMGEKLNSVYMKKGVNTFTVRVYERGQNGGSYAYPACLQIKHLETEPKVTSVRVTPEKATLAQGEVCAVSVSADMQDGSVYKFGEEQGGSANEKRSFKLVSSDENVISVSGSTVTALAEGRASITATVSFDGEIHDSAAVEIEVLPEGFTSVEVSAESQVMKPDSEGTLVSVAALDHLGNTMTSDKTVLFESSDESVVMVDENGFVTPRGEGAATITVSVTIGSITKQATLLMSVRSGKTSSSYYTEDKIKNARENILKYTWAKDMKKAAVDAADNYLGYVDMLYDMIPSQSIPRGYEVGYSNDPELRYCRYCGKDLFVYGSQPWVADALARPWKVQCQECKRVFPSNDFEKLYELGKDEFGKYNVELAHKRNAELVEETGGKTDYLKNTLYPELYDASKPSYNKDPRTGADIDGLTWGVDDGLGYNTGRVYPNGIPEVHTYIACFNHIALWYSPASKFSTAVITDAIKNFRDAYIYTGDAKYGRAGAMLLDRFADIYPDCSVKEHDYTTEGGVNVKYYHSGSVGGLIGNIHESMDFAATYATAYDAFFDLYDDPQVISYLSEKARKYKSEDKLTSEDLSGNKAVTGLSLREHVENNVLRDIFAKMQRAQIHGNFGLAQNTLTKAAIVLDDGNDTQKMIDFVMRPGVVDDAYTNYPGGNVLPQIMNVVDRDGNGNESSQGYNKHWPVNLLEMAQNLNDYDGVWAEYDILENPKFIKMLKLGHDTVLTGTQGPNIGDNGGTAARTTGLIPELYLAGFKATKDPEFARLLYFANGDSAEGIHYDIFSKDPESVQKEIENAIAEYGEFDISRSTIETGYGFAALRDGLRFETAQSSVVPDTTRDVWVYFGGGQTSHKHSDGLNIGIEAFGMNMAPDLGYPAETGTNDVRNEWISGTISHNTVVVNDEPQVKTTAAGNPIHFDGDREVKVIDVEMPKAYPMYVDKYRRTLVSVDIDDTVSYTVDFFRVVGGDEHVYSFHSQAEKTEVTGVTLVKQPMGTYAGADVPYGDTAYSAKYDSGYNWLENVERAQNPGSGMFTADFEVENLRSALSIKEYDWHLRMTMLNDFNLSEVALADGRPPESGANPERLDYILARRSGKNLDTLFTTVFEPYIKENAIKSLERVSVKRTDGKAMREEEPCAAIKVTLESGRVDYVVYAANNSVTYNIDDVFEFSGAVGVYTVPENNIHAVPERTYLLDGTKIGDKVYASAAISGRIVDFTDVPAFENYIMLETYDEVNTDAIIGSLINVENDGEENGAYRITSAEKNGNVLTIGIGDVTLIRGYKDVYNRDKGYHFNIENGQSATIALSSYESSAPVIEQAEDATVSAGSTIKIPISATCEPGRKLTFIGTVLPRGMSLDPVSGTISWKPDSSQVGENHVAITADDGMLSSTMRFTITVYGSTTSTPSKESDTSTDNSASSGGGGGGGGSSGQGSTDGSNTDTTDKTDTETTQPDASGETEKLRFTDLGNHSWAADAINSLAADGIVKGTTATTYSPAANITRADFALLLVRAFKLSSDNDENFADVSADDYFAPELAIARNCGIINGIGENKYAPRNTITRQDMMVIVYRALSASLALKGSGAERSVGAVMNDSPVDYQNRDVTEPGEMGPSNDGGGIQAPAEYPDWDTVAPYARDAVSYLIANGIVNGKSGLIAPLEYTTRAEVAVLLKRILEHKASLA